MSNKPSQSDYLSPLRHSAIQSKSTLAQRDAAEGQHISNTVMTRASAAKVESALVLPIQATDVGALAKLLLGKTPE